jgi:hypothetical protein
MRSDLSFDDPRNEFFRDRGATRIGSGSGGGGQAIRIETPTKERLSRFDKELERLADEGKPFPIPTHLSASCYSNIHAMSNLSSAGDRIVS